MSRKRSNHGSRQNPRTPAVATAGPTPTPGPSAERGTGHPPATEKKDKDDGRISLFWRVFGGTILSITAMVCVTVYQSFSSQINSLRGEIVHLNTDMRKDLGHLSESYGDLVKKEEYNSRFRNVWDTLKELRSDKEDITILKERCAVLTELFKSGQEDRRQMLAELKQMREQKACTDERGELIKEIRRIRERIALLEGHQDKTIIPTSTAAPKSDAHPGKSR